MLGQKAQGFAIATFLKFQAHIRFHRGQQATLETLFPNLAQEALEFGPGVLA